MQSPQDVLDLGAPQLSSDLIHSLIECYAIEIATLQASDFVFAETRDAANLEHDPVFATHDLF